MSGYFSPKYRELSPYVPGEQPKDRKYVKLNTNESPFPPSPLALEYAARALADLNLYSDPDCTELRRRIALTYGVTPDCVICGNGSDDILSFAFQAFCDGETPAVFADITYGFYRVFAARERIPVRIIPLKDGFRIDPADYHNAEGTVFIANPNAPTGIALTVGEIEGILKSNEKNVVVIDEAYVDFDAESCVPLIKKYRNLLVTQTFSKSRSLAGGRLGFGIADPGLIRDLDTVRCSINPYNVNAVTQAAGVGTLSDGEYTAENCKKIIKTRAYLTDRLASLGFRLTDSSANFVFAKHESIGGDVLCAKLREKGVLVRRFDTERIRDHLRITVGSDEQTEKLLCAIGEIL